MKKHMFLMKSFLAGASVVGLLLAAPLTSSASDDGGHNNYHRRQHYTAHGRENFRHEWNHYVAPYGWNGSSSHYRSHKRQQRRHNRYHHNLQHHYNRYR